MKLVSDHAVTSGNDLRRVIDFLQGYRDGVPDNAVLAETLERLGVTHIESPMADDPAGADSSGNEP